MAATATDTSKVDEINEKKQFLEELKKFNENSTKINERQGKIEEMLSKQQEPGYSKALGEKPFSFHRLMRSIATQNKDVAPHEYAVMDKYAKAMIRSGCGLQGHMEIGHWLPTNFDDYGGKATANDESAKELAYVKAVFRGTKPEFDPEEYKWLVQKGYVKAQSAFQDDLGGSLVAPPTMGDVIPLIRPQAAFLAAGAQAMTLPPSGRWVAPRITAPPDAIAVGESQDTPESNLGTGQMELTAKKIAGMVRMTEEGTQYTSGTMDNIAQSELSRTLGLKFDAYGFYGTGGTQIPIGLTNALYASQVLNVETTYPTALGIGADGNSLLPQYGDIFPALIGERSFNVDANTGAWVLRPATLAQCLSLRADAVASGDQAGPQVDIIRRLAASMDMVFKGRKVVQTTNISASYTKGATSNLSDVFYGIWQYAIMATYGAIQFQQGHDANSFKRGQVLIRGTMFGDIGFQYPPAFLWFPNAIGLGNSAGSW